MATRAKKLPASGSHEGQLAALLKNARTWRLLFLAEAGACYDDQACAALGLDRESWRQLRALAWQRGHDEFK